MFLKNGSKKNLGFSLLELMVSVSVIAVLVAIAIPQYAKFHAKSRQIEAKASLANLYAAEKNFFFQFNQYTVNLNNAGFGALGKGLRYATGFDMNGAGVPCKAYTDADSAPPEQVTKGSMNYLWNCDQSVSKSGQTFEIPTEWRLVGTVCTVQPRLPTGTATDCDSTSGQAHFRASAVGNPLKKVGTQSVDGWTIDEKKVLINSTPGI